MMKHWPERVISIALILFSSVLILSFLARFTYIRRVNIPTYNEKDSILVNAVKEAVEKHLGPDEVEKFVPVGIDLDTRRPKDRGLFELTNIAGDPPDSAPAPMVHSARVVICWVRPVEGEYTRVIGIAWDAKGTPSIFTGVVIP
jgi:hypothetical protein